MAELIIPTTLIGLSLGFFLHTRTQKIANSNTPPPLKQPHWIRFPTLYSGLYGSLILHLLMAISNGGEAFTWLFITLPAAAIPIASVSLSARLLISSFQGKPIQNTLQPTTVLLAASFLLYLLYQSSGNDDEAKTATFFLYNIALISMSWVIWSISFAIKQK